MVNAMKPRLTLCLIDLQMEMVWMMESRMPIEMVRDETETDHLSVDTDKMV